MHVSFCSDSLHDVPSNFVTSRHWNVGLPFSHDISWASGPSTLYVLLTPWLYHYCGQGRLALKQPPADAVLMNPRHVSTRLVQYYRRRFVSWAYLVWLNFICTSLQFSLTYCWPPGLRPHLNMAISFIAFNSNIWKVSPFRRSWTASAIVTISISWLSIV
jgi:hypothetical protein